MEQTNQVMFEKFITMIVDVVAEQVKERLDKLKAEERAEVLVLSPKEAMKLLDVSQTVMYNNLLKREDFPKYRVGDKWYIPKVQLFNWIENQVNNK